MVEQVAHCTTLGASFLTGTVDFFHYNMCPANVRKEYCSDKVSML